MAEIVRLRQVRKQRARAEKRTQGDANAARSGRTKADRAAERAERERERRTLDAHRRDDGE